MRCLSVLSFCAVSLLCFQCTAQDVSKKAVAFLSSLTPELKNETQRPFDHDQRTSFHYVPMDRPGPTFHDFNGKQKAAAMDLLKASLSKQGFEKSTDIMQLENVLHKLENHTDENPTGRTHRDPLNYHFLIYGDPSSKNPWGWKIEGHHVSFSFTSATGKIISSTPSFLGSNPALVMSGTEKGKEVLKRESALGFKLVNSLDTNQLAKARFSDDAPAEIMTGNQRKAGVLEPRGIQRQELTTEQQKIFDELVQTFLDNYETHFAHDFKHKIEESGWDKLSFAWAGSMTPGKGHYYRIENDVVLIEYDNTQNNANHVHTVVRDLTNDFGEDLLKEHYEHDHHK